ncbi:hypothetical protein DMENIID0001_090620 [Sergentomyia squamirostris]
MSTVEERFTAAVNVIRGLPKNGPTFADMVRTGGIPHHHNEAGADPHTPVAQSSGDMQELKEMMKQLMSQMSSMLNVLTALVPKIKN